MATKRHLLRYLDGAVTRVATWWPMVGAIVMAYLSHFVEWINHYGVFGWACVAIVTYFVLVVAYWLYALAKRYLFATHLAEKQADTSFVNPLAGVFTNQRLKWTDFFHPFYKPTTDARFEGCEFVGPGLVALMGCNLSYDTFTDCQIVIVKEGTPVIGATAFDRCNFLHSTFFQTTFLMTAEQYAAFDEALASTPVQHRPQVIAGQSA